MKRLYVTPAGRGSGAGKRLVNAIIDTACSLGYKEIRLDTLPSMNKAISLYQDAGFTRIESYYKTPIDGTIFFALKLPG